MAQISIDYGSVSGGSSKGVYITVECDSAYQGYDIILTADGNEIDKKQCSSSLKVTLFASANTVTLPTTFTISNSLNGIIKNMSASICGWYETILIIDPIALVPVISSDTPDVFTNSYKSGREAYRAFDNNSNTVWCTGDGKTSNVNIGYNFNKLVCVTRVVYQQSYWSGDTKYLPKNVILQGFNTSTNLWENIESFVGKAVNTSQTHNITNSTYYTKYQLYIVDSYATASNYNIALTNLQFYGYEA